MIHAAQGTGNSGRTWTRPQWIQISAPTELDDWGLRKIPRSATAEKGLHRTLRPPSADSRQGDAEKAEKRLNTEFTENGVEGTEEANQRGAHPAWLMSRRLRMIRAGGGFAAVEILEGGNVRGVAGHGANAAGGGAGGR
jgi:hypothetical protein